MGRLAPDLLGPVGLALARAVEHLPGPQGMPGGSRFELKWDGFRAGAVCRDGEVRLWSRNGKDLTAKFPDVQKALARQIAVDCVLDGELVVWNGERLDFDALQQRNANTAATVRNRLAPAQPASFVVFDVLAVDSVDIRSMRWTTRRGRLESLAQNWQPPLQLSPATDDPAEAREWLAAFKASGVEGLVVKGASTRYHPGRRDWVKVNSVGVPRVRFAAALGVVPGQRVLWRGDVVRDGCRGRAATWSRSSLRGWLSFEFEFAWAVEAVLGERAWPGGSTYEPQWDGYLH